MDDTLRESAAAEFTTYPIILFSARIYWNLCMWPHIYAFTFPERFSTGRSVCCRKVHVFVFLATLRVLLNPKFPKSNGCSSSHIEAVHVVGHRDAYCVGCFTDGIFRESVPFGS